MIDKINIRVYAIYLNKNNELMALDEGYAGEKLVKLPGGGLEFGEGTIESVSYTHLDVYKRQIYCSLEPH